MVDLQTYFLDRTIRFVAPNVLKPSPTNPRVSLRLADPEAFAALKESIRRGFFAPILVEGSTLEIIGGHQRVDAARELGIAEVPVIFLRDLTDEEKTRIRIADNGSFGMWDLPMLRLQIDTLPKAELPLLGLDSATLDVVAPLADHETAAAESERQTWETLKFKVPTEAAGRITNVIETICTKQKCKPGTALAYVVEVFAQDPDHGIE